MAIQKTSDLSFGTNVKNIVRSQVNRRVVLANLLEFRPGNNSNVRWNVEIGGKTVATHAEGAAFPVPDADTVDEASLSFGMYHTAVEVSDFAIATAAVSNNPAAYNSLFLRQLRTASQRLAKELETDSFSGSGSNSIIGLDTALADDNTYAGIDRTSVAAWKAHVKDPGTPTALTKADLRGFLYDVADNGGEGMPNVALCSYGVFNKIIGLYDGNVQYNAPTVVGSTTLTNAVVEGVMVVPVSGSDGYDNSSTGWLYTINTDLVYFETIPYADTAKVLFNLPFGMQVVTDPSGAHSEKAVLRTMMQLVVEKPAACGVMKNISV